MINLTSLDQEKYLNQIAKDFEYQSNLIKIYPSSNNFPKCLLDTAALISLLKIGYLTPSNYYLLYKDISNFLEETIEFYIRDKVTKGIKIKYIYESIQQCQYVIPRIYLMIICGSIYLEFYPIKFREIIYDLLNAAKCVQNPLRAFWIRYFLFKKIKNYLPINIGTYLNNEEYFYEYRKISLLFFLENLEEMIYFAIRIRKEIFIDDKKLNEKQRTEICSSIEEIIQDISSFKGLDKNIFVNKVLPKFYDIISNIDDTKDFYLEHIVIAGIIKNFNIELYFDPQGISIIFLTFRKVIYNKDFDIISIFTNLVNNYIKFIKYNNKQENELLKKENISTIKITFDLFFETYNELQTTYKNSEDQEFNKFLELDSSFLKLSFKILKFEKKESKVVIIHTILNSCSKRINMFNYGFKIETLKKIGTLIEILFKHKITIFDFPVLETMINYLDYNQRRKISLKLIDSFDNKNTNKIDTLEKISKILNIIIPLITEEIWNNMDGTDVTQKFKEENKNRHLCKLIYLINCNDPDIFVKMLNKIKTSLESGSIETTTFTIPIIINYIINYIKNLELYYKDFVNGQKKDEKNNETNKYNIDIPSDIKNDNKKVYFYFINIMYNILNLLKESILIIENNNNIEAFRYYLLVCYLINKMDYISQINKNLFNELFDEFFQKAMNILKNIEKSEIKYQMIQYLLCYAKKFTLFFDKFKEKTILSLIENEFYDFNDLKNYFNIAINLCDFLYFITKDYKNLEKYIIIIFQLLIKDLESHDNVYLLITLINKLLYYMGKENKPFLIDIINKSIKFLNEAKFFKLENNKQTYKNTFSYYKNTLGFIEKRKNKNNDSIYKSIILK